MTNSHFRGMMGIFSDPEVVNVSPRSCHSVASPNACDNLGAHPRLLLLWFHRQELTNKSPLNPKPCAVRSLKACLSNKLYWGTFCVGTCFLLVYAQLRFPLYHPSNNYAGIHIKRMAILASAPTNKTASLNRNSYEARDKPTGSAVCQKHHLGKSGASQFPPQGNILKS